ncbi:MAG: YfhO family protein [Actinobacteria bacterium]|nr:YfhO family protein [Actinomycetota bacterium]MBU1942236.1 YfhO family protein [Actinomycetota bacterium]MBU2687415.1 YfhO family protein [Actinomycetota bacterium]
MRYSRQLGVPLSPMPLVAVPWGLDTSPYTADPLSALLLRVLSVLFDETVAYNLILLVSFVLAGLAMYWLVEYLTRDRSAAALSGLAFAFSPYMLAQGKEHLGLVMTFWMPLFVLALVRAWRHGTWKSVLTCGGVYLVLVLFNYQYGLIAGVFAAVFSLTLWITGRPWRIAPGRGRFWKALPVLAVVVAVLVLLLLQLAASHPPEMGAQAALQFSARPWDYLLPAADGWALGYLTRGFILSHLHGGFLSESSLFIGYTVMALAALGLVLAFRRPATAVAEPPPLTGATRSRILEAMPDDRRRITFSVAACGLVAFILSMPPYFHLGSTRVYLPSCVFLEVFPSFRAYARFGISVMLSACVLAGLGLWRIDRALPSKKPRRVLLAVLMALVLLEFAIIPPFRSLDTGDTTDYYRWLAARPEATVAAMYPMYQLDDFHDYEYLFYQRLHRKALVNGARGGEAALFRDSVLDVTFPSTPGLLARLGTDLVLVLPGSYAELGPPHRNYTFPTDITRRPVPEGLSEVKRFSGCVAYRVTAPASDLVPLFAHGFFEPFMDPTGTFRHPADSRATVRIESYLHSSATCSITFEAACAAGTCDLAVSIDAIPAATARLTTGAATVKLQGVTLKPGTNELTLTSDGVLRALSEVPGYSGARVAMILGDIMVEEQR